VRKANTNVISVKLGALTQDVSIATGTTALSCYSARSKIQWSNALLGFMHEGDPVFCTQCQAALSATDVARLASEGKNKNKEKEEYAQVWHCLFCGTDNELNLDEEEVPTRYSAALIIIMMKRFVRSRMCVCVRVQMPKEESVDYILEAASEAGVSGGSSSSEKQLVFCIDISGSM
jgi:hypothetical protein